MYLLFFPYFVKIQKTIQTFVWYSKETCVRATSDQTIKRTNIVIKEVIMQLFITDVLFI